MCSIHHMYVVTKFAWILYWGLWQSASNWRCPSKNNSLFLPRTTTIKCYLLWRLKILWKPNESHLNVLFTICFKYYTFHVAQCIITKMCTGQLSYYSSIPKGSKQFVLPIKLSDCLWSPYILLISAQHWSQNMKLPSHHKPSHNTAHLHIGTILSVLSFISKFSEMLTTAHQCFFYISNIYSCSEVLKIELMRKWYHCTMFWTFKFILIL